MLEDTRASILVVVDMQNDFINGVLGSEAAQNIIPEVKKRIEQYNKGNRKIIFTRDMHDKNSYCFMVESYIVPFHCEYDKPGFAIYPDLVPEMNPNILIVDKLSFGVDGESWKSYFRDLGFPTDPQSIEICGLCTDICVVSNALILRSAFPETEIIVNSKLCAGTSEEAHDAALKVMSSCCIEVLI